MAWKGGVPTAKVNPSHHVPACPGARTGNKQLMHRGWQVIGSLLGGLSLGLAGCAVTDQPGGSIRHVYVREATGATLSDLLVHDAVIHDTSVRVLSGRGYVAALEPSAADALLRSAWIVRPPAEGAGAPKVSLRLTLERKDGRILRSFEAIDEVPVRFLSPERVADHVRARLGTINRGPTAAP